MKCSSAAATCTLLFHTQSLILIALAGFIVSDEGVKPDPDRISALSDFPVPTDQTGVWSFLGLCNQLAGLSAPHDRFATAHWKRLPLLWLPEHQHEFDNLKRILSGDLVVRHFDPSKNVILLTDTSRLHGLGYALGHIDIDNSGSKHFKIVHSGSKGLTSTQQRYSTVELECLAIVWARSKCSFYLHGLPKFTVYTDHRPLERIFQKDSNACARRLLNFPSKLIGFPERPTSSRTPCHVPRCFLPRNSPIWK